jgi:hypothetical protein
LSGDPALHGLLERIGMLSSSLVLRMPLSENRFPLFRDMR